MKIYTKTGDDGRTGLLGPGRVAKDDPRIEAYGSVDELNAVLGVARALDLDESLQGPLALIQLDLFAVGAALADPDPDGRFQGAISTEHAERLELVIDAFEADLPPLTHFIVPGGSPAAAQLHLARTVCRRAERQVVHLAQQAGQSVPEPLVVYLNRLSDLLFVLARAANRSADVQDLIWEGLP